MSSSTSKVTRSNVSTSVELAKSSNQNTCSSSFKSSSESTENSAAIDKSLKNAPSQQSTKDKIILLEKQLNSFYHIRDSMPSDNINDKILKIKNELKLERQTLKRKEHNAEYQKEYRDRKKAKIEEICTETPELRQKMSIRESVGRPSLDCDQPLLIKTIADIAIMGSAAECKRRDESIRCIKTLDELTEALNKMGYNLSRSATYLRLLPKNVRSTEGKRHVTTVPVKLSRAQADFHRSHNDSHFAATSIHYLECLASILGSAQVFFMSQDDKARVPIGITAAHKQAALLMHMQYRVTLPDHDWVKADRHKLIPSVYACIAINSKSILGDSGAIGYSGPTFIAIRSGKHSSSTAYTHAHDFKTLLNVKEFQPFLKTEEGFVKPVVIVTVDGGPDENPRYGKVIASAIKHFTT